MMYTGAIIFLTSGILLAMLGVYFVKIRPWHLRWGATREELLLKLPGDDIVEEPDFNATRAITIKTAPEHIWPWLLQIGTGRAGWYSIDWIDNGGVESSDRVLPEFQTIVRGGFIPFTTDQKNGMWVNDFKEHEYILWVDKNGQASWLWYLLQLPGGQTRLLTRLRTQYNWKGLWILYYILYDIGDIIMMSHCMKGIKKRAEAHTGSDSFLKTA